MSNMVVVRKANHEWCMCVDSTDLNVAYPKDPYMLSYMNLLINGSSSY